MLVLAGAPLFAQSNSVAGTDVNLYDVASATVYGRRGPSYPNGQVGIGYGHAFCNGGTVHVPWATSPTTQGQMTDVHFKIAFLVTRELNGRMEQISLRETGVKHSRVTYNLGSSNCGTCQSGPSSTFRMGCYDAYTTGFNGNQFNLAPSSEINPWTGSWNPVGSYFDHGDPMVGGAAATDGVQSLTSQQVNAFDNVKNRITLNESEVAQGGTYYGQVHLVCEGEPVANRGNNQRSARLAINWSGSSWSVSNQGGEVIGSVLNQWSGANVVLAGNGVDDGRFAIASKVTGPVAGNYRYEYAIHNIDNNRGGASFRIPLAAPIVVTNAGFGDIDQDGGNEWGFTQTPTELSWTMPTPSPGPSYNPLDWNTIYNFYFDSPEAPGAGGVVIDQARVGPGALTVTAQAEVPGGVVVAAWQPIGSGCGHCDTSFYEEFITAGSIDLSGSSASLNYNNGVYSVGAGTAAWQTPAGQTLTLGDDSEVILNLPFSLPYPGGSTNTLFVCSNGFVSPIAGNGTLWLPLPALLLSQKPRWAVAWHDYAPNVSGQVRAAVNAAGATLSWVAVANSNGIAGNSTFQVQFKPNGDVHYLWQNLSTQGNGYLVGWSPGLGASNPGSTDLSAALAGGINLCASVPPPLDLQASARPLLGTTVQQITGSIAPGTAFGVLVQSLDLATPAIDLTSYGMEGCFAHTQGITTGATVNQLFIPGAATSISIPLTIPNDMSLMGMTVVSQSYTLLPPLTSSGIINSNAIHMLLGPL